MIRTNVLTATRNFQHRVDAFRKEVMMGKNNPMKIKHISYRVEFQGRGAAHIHGTLWLDLKEIEKSKEFKDEMEKRGKAMRKSIQMHFGNSETMSDLTIQKKMQLPP